MTTRQYVVAGFAVPEGLEDFHRLLATVARDHPGIGSDDLVLFETAVVEIAANVIEHAGEGVTWTFDLAVTATELRGTLVDNGVVADLDLDAALPTDPLAEAGRGLAIARAALDEFTYDRVDGTNRWVLVRRRGRGAAD